MSNGEEVQARVDSPPYWAGTCVKDGEAIKKLQQDQKAIVEKQEELDGEIYGDKDNEGDGMKPQLKAVKKDVSTILKHVETMNGAKDTTIKKSLSAVDRGSSISLKVGAVGGGGGIVILFLTHKKEALEIAQIILDMFKS